MRGAENPKDHISSDKLPSGAEETVFGVVYWEDGAFLKAATDSLPFDVHIPRLQHVL